MKLAKLDDIFRMQDTSAQQNRSELLPEFCLLEKALLLMAELIEFSKFDSPAARQTLLSCQLSHAQKCQLNLAQASWATTVNACRLLAFGAFVDMFSLYRGAVESFSYFWYLRRVPSDLSKWIEIFEQNGTMGRKETYTRPIKENEEREEPKVILELAVEHSYKLNSFRQRAKCRFEGDAEKGKGRKDLFKMLSTIGTHTNPFTMYGSLPSQTHENNLGFSSIGNTEFLNYGMYYALILLKSYLEEIDLAFGRYVPKEHELRCRYIQVEREFDEYVQSLSADWVPRLPPGRTSI